MLIANYSLVQGGEPGNLIILAEGGVGWDEEWYLVVVLHWWCRVRGCSSGRGGRGNSGGSGGCKAAQN